MPTTSTKTIARFTIGTSRVEITLERASLPQPAHPKGYVSFTGSMSSHGLGQIVSDLRESTVNTNVRDLCDGWDLYHLKDDPGVELDRYAALLEQLNGRHIDPPDVEDDDLEDCEFNNAADLIDSRQVIARIEYLRAFVEEHPTHEDAAHELKVLEALEDEASGYAADWRYGETLIRDSYFEDYAKELAEDIGAIKNDAVWPNTCIDWAQAARELQQDYSCVKFDGVDYWVR